MISPDSDLYREHPDWCLHVLDRKSTESRYQLVLDLSRKDVCDEIIKRISDILASAPITYLKWDMNHHLTEVGSSKLSPDKQREIYHRYVLGLYRILDTITTRFPHILLDGCSSGGGRFDLGFCVICHKFGLTIVLMQLNDYKYKLEQALYILQVL